VEPEAFGRVPVEAAAMGKPVIATDHGGARETVLTGESGLLVRPGDAQSLGYALAALLALPAEKLAEMGAHGRAHVEARYTLQSMCAKTLALYDDLLKVARKS
jgi:glycosyltransferase involved in cell wall biosynthesis